MTEVKRIKQSLARDGSKAFVEGKNHSGAYIMRGNSIVRVTANGNIEVVKKTSQVRVKVKDSHKVVFLK